MDITGRRAASVIALLTATAFSALAGPPSQGAVPAGEWIGHETTFPSPNSTPDPPAQERPCFMWRSHWNVALDGPEPTCSLTPRS